MNVDDAATRYQSLIHSSHQSIEPSVSIIRKKKKKKSMASSSIWSHSVLISSFSLPKSFTFFFHSKIFFCFQCYPQFVQFVVWFFPPPLVPHTVHHYHQSQHLMKLIMFNYLGLPTIKVKHSSSENRKQKSKQKLNLSTGEQNWFQNLSIQQKLSSFKNWIPKYPKMGAKCK